MVFKVFFLVSIVLFYVNCSTLPLCPENQVWNNCQSACPTTCTTKDEKPKQCILSCQGGCGCQSGYVFENDKFEKCIKVNDCVKTVTDGPTGGGKCTRNEVYSECNAHCQKSCEGESDNCTRQCVPGCICGIGFIRSKRVGGICIADDTCPK